jgi:hypothetical protein
VAKPHPDRGLGDVSRFTAIGEQRTEPERRHFTVAIVQREPMLPGIFD